MPGLQLDEGAVVCLMFSRGPLKRAWDLGYLPSTPPSHGSASSLLHAEADALGVSDLKADDLDRDRFLAFIGSASDGSV